MTCSVACAVAQDHDQPEAMNKARAMLDALMGPNRNEKEVDKAKATRLPGQFQH